MKINGNGMIAYQWSVEGPTTLQEESLGKEYHILILDFLYPTVAKHLMPPGMVRLRSSLNFLLQFAHTDY